MDSLAAALLVLALTALLSGCAGFTVTSDSNPNLSVSVCRTYAWAAEFRDTSDRAPTITNPLMESRLRAAIAANLQAKGVQVATAGTEASCLVGYSIGLRTIVEGGYPYGWGWPGPYGWGWDGPHVYQRGLVAVDLYQTQGRQPLWHAVVEQNLAGLTGRDAEAKVNEAVAALFSKYPH